MGDVNQMVFVSLRKRIIRKDLFVWNEVSS